MLLRDESRIRDITNKAVTDLVQTKGFNLDFINALTDARLYSHLLGVARIALQLGICYKYSSKKLLNLAKACLLHDLGKLYIDQSILYAPRRLTDSEFEIVKQHTVMGYEKLKSYTDNELILEAARHHHEKTGGVGYPDAEKDIDFIVQLITVADIFSALTELRCYKPRLSLDKVFEIMEGDSGINQSIVEELRKVVLDDETMYILAARYAKWIRETHPWKGVFETQLIDFYEGG